MLVREVMSSNPVTILPTDNLKTAIERMGKLYRRLPVVDENGRLVGIITDRDLRLAVHSPYILRERWQDEQLLTNTLVDNCMTPAPAYIGPDEHVQQAIQLILKGRFSGLPVVDEDKKVIGVITVTDLLRAFDMFLTRLSAHEEELEQ
ncbi:MAG: hypothetical protein CUN55_06870 [Phototrophicales bacterium]|nr:MAG: hypothetical protein CUN55_06870 [Phototrophicales bacterium]